MSVAFAFEPAASFPEPFSLPTVVTPPARLGPYVVLERIAEGGMATIFRGQDLRTGDLVALKTVRADVTSQIQGLDREIALLRRLSHPGIVRFLDEGSWNGLPWMALQLLDGTTLFDEISALWRQAPDVVEGCTRSLRAHRARANAAVDDTGPHGDWARALDEDPALAAPPRAAAAGRLRDVVHLAARLAPVLDHVHDHGVVHRDVKPENIILDRAGHVTLLDFGLACWPRQRARTEPARWCMGTAEYAAPEQIRGDRVDARADLYSFGCILYELVTGRRPFEGPSPDDIACQHLEWDPTPPSDLVTGLSWQVEDLILSLLAKDPRNRPRRAGGVAADLARLIPRPRHN